MARCLILTLINFSVLSQSLILPFTSILILPFIIKAQDPDGEGSGSGESVGI